MKEERTWLCLLLVEHILGYLFWRVLYFLFSFDPEHSSSPTFVSGDGFTLILIFCVVFCQTLFPCLPFSYSPLYCISLFDLSLLITTLASSNVLLCSSCFTSCTDRVILNENHVINHKIGEDRIMLTTSGTYPWLFVLTGVVFFVCIWLKSRFRIRWYIY
jgi:hypothetical protein